MTRQRFLTLWAGAGCLVLLVMLTHQSEPATILGRYSLSYALLMALVAFTIGVATLSRRVVVGLPKWFSTPLAGVVVVSVGAVALGAWWWVPLTQFLFTTALLKIYIAGVLLVLTLSLMTTTRTLSVWSVGVVTVVLVGVGVGLFLGKVPPSVYYDEPMIANWGVSWVKNGTPALINALPLRTVTVGGSANGALFPLGLWLQTVGVSYANARWGAWLLTLWGLPFVWMTARRWYGTMPALFASLLYALLAVGESYVRSDSFVAVGVAVALWAYSRSETNPYWHVLVGFALAFAIEGHQLGVRFALVVGVIYAVRYAYRVWHTQRWVIDRAFWFLVLGGLAYALIYVGLRLWWNHTDLNGYLALIREAYAYEAGVGKTDSFFTRFSTNISGFVLNMAIAYPLETLFALLGIFTLFSTAPAKPMPTAAMPKTAFVAWVWVGSLLLFTVLSPKSFVYYYVHQLPLIALLGGAFAHAYAKPQQIALMALSGVLIFAHYSQIQRDNGVNDLREVAQDISQHLPMDAEPIVGQLFYYLGLEGRQVYDSDTFNHVTIPEALAQGHILPPQVILITRGFDEEANVLAYIESAHFERARCYPIQSVGTRVEVFVLPQIAPTWRDEGC